MSTKKLQIINGLGSKVYTQADEPTDAVDGSLWLDLDEESVGGSNGVNVAASVGQTIIVEEVDAEGKPTKWKAADYQKKICGDELGYIIPATVVNYENGDEGTFMVDTLLVEGKTYVANWDGVDYNCVCWTAEADGATMFVIGNRIFIGEETDTGEPFVIATMEVGGVKMGSAAAIDASATSFTFSVKGEVTIPIPVQYVTNALPYYIEVSGSGTTDDPFVCNDTVENVETIFNSDRPLVARLLVSNKLDDSSDIVFVITYMLNNHLCSKRSDVAHTTFGFSNCGLYSSADNIMVFLNPQEDGTYKVTKTIEG